MDVYTFVVLGLLLCSLLVLGVIMILAYGTYLMCERTPRKEELDEENDLIV